MVSAPQKVFAKWLDWAGLRGFLYMLILFLVGVFMVGCKPKSKKQTPENQKVIKKSSPVAIPKKISELEQRMINQGLVNIQTIDPTLMVELKYSTTDNFVHTDVYGDLENAYLQQKPAEMLTKANGFLKEDFPEYRLLIYDGARPLRVQHILWNLLDSIPPARRREFVSSPTETSIHNYGSAVDLTIYDLSTKKPLDMGTKFDFFGELAYPKKENQMLKAGKLTPEQVENRKVLRSVMLRAGFTPIESEWWHFNAISRKRAKETYKIVE
jgi:D-alanyl-D-alanine dipeptidase